MAAWVSSCCSSLCSGIAYLLCCRCCRSAPIAPNLEPPAPQMRIVVDQLCRYIEQAADPQTSPVFDRAIQDLRQTEQGTTDELAFIVDTVKGRIIGHNNRLPRQLGDEEDALLGRPVTEIVSFLFMGSPCPRWQTIVGMYFTNLDKGIPFQLILANRPGRKHFLTKIVINHLSRASLESKNGEAVDRKDGHESHESNVKKIEDLITKFPYLFVMIKPHATPESERNSRARSKTVNRSSLSPPKPRPTDFLTLPST